LLATNAFDFSALKRDFKKGEEFSSSFAFGTKEFEMRSFSHESSRTSSTFASSYTMSSTQTIVSQETAVQQFLTSEKRKPSLLVEGDIKMIQDLELISVRLKGPQTTNIEVDIPEGISEGEIVYETMEIPRRLTLPDVDVAHDFQLKRVDQAEVSEKVTQRRFSSHTEEASSLIRVAEETEGMVTIQEVSGMLWTTPTQVLSQRSSGVQPLRNYPFSNVIF
jgi:hypothetical protein